MKKLVAMAMAALAAVGAWAGVDLALGFEEYAQGTPLTEENCSALMSNESATLSVFDNGGNVACAGGFAPPFTSAGTNAVRIKTTLGNPCAFGFKENNTDVEISKGHPYCVDFLARFTAFDSDINYSFRSTPKALLSMNWQDHQVMIVARCGFCCSIDDGILLWQREVFDYNDEPVATNWCVTAGDGSGGVTNYVLTALGDEPIPDGDATECDGGSSGWHRITFKACRAADSDSLFFKLFIGGRQVRAGDTTDFPSMTAGTSISSVRFDGQGDVDNIVAYEEPPPEIRNVTARQRWPWNGKVDITFDVVGDVMAGLPAGNSPRLSVIVSNCTDGTSFEASRPALSGDTGTAEGRHHVVWDAWADLGEVVYSNIVVRVALVDPHDKVQLWEGGPYWATTNIGAEKPEGYGYYFWWGDTVGYKRVGGAWVASDGSSSNFSFGDDNAPTYTKDVATLRSEGWITAAGVLASTHDAAHVQWGGEWRMPTKDELSALINNCDWTWTTTNGVNGYIVRGKGDYASASIFLPAAGFGLGSLFLNAGERGFCWSSVPSSGSGRSWRLYFGSDGHYADYGDGRDDGFAVRPVQGFTEAQVTSIAPAGDSRPFLLDARTGVRESKGVETLTYSSFWNGDANATVTIAQDGVAIAEGLAGEDTYSWSVQKVGTYVLTHTTYTNGVAGKVESATFVLPGPELTFEYDGGPFVGGNVTIGGNLVGWTVYYTTDGSTPTTASPAYTGPFALPAATTVKAFAVSDTGVETEVFGQKFAVVEHARIENVRARQRWPWNGKVDIDFDVVGDVTLGVPEDRQPYLVVKARDVDTGMTYVITGVDTPLTGDIGNAPGWHRVVWDMRGHGLDIVSSNIVFTVAYQTTPLYCIIDLSNDASVSYMSTPPIYRFNSDEYKTTKLVMRLIEPGVIPTHDAMLTKQYYIGVFEVTQRQYELVMGDRPSYFDWAPYYATRPVEQVSYDMIRGSSNGAGWPDSSVVDESSFMWALRTKSGVASFDLPTEAQWEYACRAGTTTDYNNGQNCVVGEQDQDTAMDEVGRYLYNFPAGVTWYSSGSGLGQGTAKVGSYLPNAWGLYDMHGNVYEWCLDRWGGYYIAGSDPVGPSSGSGRVLRGGSWHDPAYYCVSSGRNGYFSDGPSNMSLYNTVGFRLARTLSATESNSTLCTNESGPVNLDLSEGPCASLGDETLTYSSLWDGDANATVTIAQDGVAIAEGLTDEDTYAWGVTRNGTYVLTHTTYTNGVAGAVETATFVVTGKDVPFAPGDVTVTSYSNKYDGAAHGITVASEIAGIVYKYANGEVGATSPTSGWSNVAPTLTDVGAMAVWVEISAPGYITQTNSETIMIQPRLLTQGMVGAIGNHPYTGKAQTPKPMVTDVERGVTLREGVEYTLSYANNTAVGEGIVTVTGKGNYAGSIARMFVIEPSSGSELEESLGGAGKAESDGAGGWIVTITNDVDTANLPIVIPDDLGNVTIDLNGHDLIGPDGGFIETALPAIRIVPGHDEGGPTQLTIVTSGGDAIVQGGEGAPAVEVAEGAQDGVIINIGEGVTVQGGGVPAIDGTIGENNGTLVKVEVPVPAIASKEYTGGQLKADISATDCYTVVNNGGVDAGNYPVTLTLADVVNYRWAGSDSNPTTVTFTITKATNAWITEPSIAGWTYGDAPSEPNMGAAKFGTATVAYGALGAERPTEAGDYTATFTVAGTDNYTGLSKSVDFTIAKRPVAVTVAGHTATYTYDGTEKSVEGYDAATEDALYDVAEDTVFDGAALPSAARTDVGVTTMGLTAANFKNKNANFDVAYAVIDGWVEITSTKELDELAESFGGLPVAITPDDEGGWIVTITNDIDSADLPIEIPDNIGNVTIDLNGYDLGGHDGARPSQDGHDGACPSQAIVIVNGEGDGEPTVLTIVTGGGDAIVQGGEGAPAIEVADGVQEGVLVNIGEGVTVQGGDEYTPAIIGEVGVNEGTIVEPSRVHIPGEGTVTKPKSWKTGQKVTWKAAAAKGSVFARWKGDFVESLGLSRNELRNPSLQFIVPQGFDESQVSAEFISIDDDGLRELSFRDADGNSLGDGEGILLAFGEPVEFWLVDDSKSYVTASASGLPSGLRFDAKTMKVTGTPTKRNAYWVQVKAKNASGYQWAEKVRMAVSGYATEPNEPKLTRTAYHPLTVVSSDAAAGTVSGTGVYAEGKKASISAKPAKGRVFAGWYRDAALTKPMEFASGDCRKASQSVVVPEVRYLFARFVEATAAGDPITGLAARGSGIVAESCFKWCVGVAVPEGDGVEYASASLPSASAAKLPAGVKFDAAKGRFTGVPTKAGTYVATVTVKNASKSTGVLGLTIEVAALPAWAVGTFSGAVVAGARDARPYQGGDVDARPYQDGDAENEVGSRVPRDLESEEPVGTISLTVGATGKISGKILEGGKTWTLSAGQFNHVEHVEQVGGSDVFYATVIGKAGKEIVTNEVTVSAENGVGVATSQPFNLSTFQPFNFSWTAWQNLWKRADTKAAQPVFKKNIVTDLYLGEAGDANNRLQLTFKKDGAVSFSGKIGGVSVSGSAQVVMIGGFIETALPKWQVTFYAPPKKDLAGWCETFPVELTLDEQNVVVGVAAGE